MLIPQDSLIFLLSQGQRANLHEVITTDRLDFEAKQQRMARRKQWLKRNQQLLRTLLTYCSLYGASGGGLACIKMELILLLQVGSICSQLVVV